MRNPDAAFRQSDPTENRHFRRMWTEPARALRIVPPVPAVRTLDHIAIEILTAWRADAGVR